MPKQNGANGEHVVTMREVAKAAGVSIKTVSNVVNDYEFVSQATRDKVNKAIDELGYTLNVSARNLNRGKTGFITLAVPTLTAPYLSELANRVIDAARGAERAAADAAPANLSLDVTPDDIEVVDTVTVVWEIA